MMTVVVEDSRLLKHICITEEIDIPADTAMDERYKLGKEARNRLRETIAKAVEPYIVFGAYTPESGKFRTKASITLLNAAELKGELE